MTAEEQTAFKNHAHQLPYLIRSRATKQTERIAQIGLSTMGLGVASANKC
jgi:hypothetical protein